MTKEEVVQAEILDDSKELIVSSSPGNISANFDVLEARVDAILSQYEGWTPSSDDKDEVAQCARERKYLNGLAKQIDERRKAVKNEYLKPLNDFEARANGIRDKIKDVSGRLSEVEKEAEQARKDAKFAELQEHYEDFAGLLVPVVPYEKFHNPKWLNKTFSISTAKAELEHAIQKVAADWETLKETKLDYPEEAEAYFFNTLDLGEAIKYSNKLADDRKKIEEMKAEMAAPVEEPVQVQNPDAGFVDNEPEPGTVRITTDALGSYPWVMIIDSATLDQVKEIGSFCGSIDVTGRFSRGTLADAYNKQCYEAAQRYQGGYHG